MPILLVQAPGGMFERKGLDADLEDLLFARHAAATQEDDRLMAMGLGRGVGAERLGVILRTGIDVEPTDHPIFTEIGLDKALEYGCDGDQVIMLLDPRKLSSTWEEVPANSDESVLNELRSRFPTELRSDDGTRIWFSRLPKDDRRVASPYEARFARWIPGDPKEALLGLIVLSEKDLDATERFVRQQIEGSAGRESGA